MLCPKCGAENPGDGVFCCQCGETLNQTQQPTVVQLSKPTDGSTEPYAAPVYDPIYQQPNYAQPVSNEGRRAATTALICGIISINAFIAGIVLGIIAIAQANKAERLGYTGKQARIGRILGIVGIVLWAVVLVVYVIAIVACTMYYTNYSSPYYNFNW